MMGDSLEEESWELMTHRGKCLFEEMCHMCNMAANSNLECHPIWKCAKYLWAVIQVHKLMQEYIDHSFCEHASIFPVINYHMFSTIVSCASLDKLKQDMQASLRAFDARCNQIDVLSTKDNCLGGTGNNGTWAASSRGRKGGRAAGSTDPEWLGIQVVPMSKAPWIDPRMYLPPSKCIVIDISESRYAKYGLTMGSLLTDSTKDLILLVVA